MTDPIARLSEALRGRYAVEHELGEGGMAVVYLAQELRHPHVLPLFDSDEEHRTILVENWFEELKIKTGS